MIKEFTSPRFDVVSGFGFVFIFPAELQLLHLISSTSFSKCSKIRAVPCKMLHVHWKKAGLVLSGVFEHGDTSGCSISSERGELPPSTLVQQPCTSQMVIKLSKQGLPGLQGACSWCSMWQDYHSSSHTYGVSSPEHGQSAVGLSSRWVCAAWYMVYTHFHCLSVLGKRAVFLALFPALTAIYSYKVFTLAGIITKEIVQLPFKLREKSKSKDISLLSQSPNYHRVGKNAMHVMLLHAKIKGSEMKKYITMFFKSCTYRVEATTSYAVQMVFLLPGRSAVRPESFNLSYI